MSPDPDFVHRQLLAHVRSLHAAGVEWVPNGPSLAVTPAAAALAVDNPAVVFKAGPSVDERRQALQVLADEVKLCTRCPDLCSTRTQTVFADGSLGAEVCFIGEAPGADEDA